MLTHHRTPPQHPARTVILGAGGFVGSTITNLLHRESADLIALTRRECDLLAPDGCEKLSAVLQPTDTLIFISADAPVKNAEMLIRNLQMAETVIAAVKAVPVDHLIYVSSDAVYCDTLYPMGEQTATAPGSLHGVMHLAREVMLKNELPDIPLAVVRPTLIYGAKDPHNGYGPNQFRRRIEQGEDIKLFGEGEERRDHISVDDVATLLYLILNHRSTGTLNAATGTVTSFRDVAALTVKIHNSDTTISGSPRAGPMPHNGYRAFDPAATFQAFPDFSYTPLADGVKRIYEHSKDAN